MTDAWTSVRGRFERILERETEPDEVFDRPSQTSSPASSSSIGCAAATRAATVVRDGVRYPAFDE